MSTNGKRNGSRAFQLQHHAGFIQECIYPIAEFIPEGVEKPETTPIISRENCLDFDFIHQATTPSVIAEFTAGGIKHRLCNVLKPYSESGHLMIIRDDATWAPSPNFYEKQAGIDVCHVASEALRYISEFGRTACFGWNASPFYYIEDGYSCFASLPSLWHPQIWVIGDIPTYLDEPLPFARWTPISTLTPIQRRALFENEYGILFCKELYRRMKEAIFARHWPLCIDDRCGELSPYFTPRGMIIPLEGSVRTMLHDPQLFADTIQPLDRLIYNLMADIHYAIFEMNYDQRIEIMRKSNRSGGEMAFLTTVAPLRSLSEAATRFSRARINDRLLAVLWPYARNLAEQCGNNTDRLIQGPAYSVVFAEDIETRQTTLTIMPGFPQGPGGVVEALGILLSRPINYKMPIELLKERSARLYPLSEIIKGINF